MSWGLIFIAALAIAIGGCQIIRNSGDLALPAASADTLRIGSWNVHYIISNRKDGRWGTDHWERRKVPMDNVFKALDADIIAFQEMESFAGGNDDSNNLTRSWLSEQNPGYAIAAIGDWRDFPSTQPIFYRPEVVSAIEQGWFFFSETPDQIYSRTFNGSYPAFASWVRFKVNENQSRLLVVNVHLDYSSRENRTRSIALIIERMQPWLLAGEQLTIVGDLNARFGSSLHTQIETAGLNFIPVSGSTYHFNVGLNLFGAIDHIAYTDGLTAVGSAHVLRAKMGSVWATDHYPVVADFLLD